jgi:hypothetical protein
MELYCKFILALKDVTLIFLNLSKHSGCPEQMESLFSNK